MVWVVWAVRRKVAVRLSFGGKVLHALPANVDLALDAGHLVTAAPLLDGCAAVLVGAHPTVGGIHCHPFL